MAQKSVSAIDKTDTPIGVKWNLKENADGRLEWHAESKSGVIIVDQRDKKKRAKPVVANVKPRVQSTVNFNRPKATTGATSPTDDYLLSLLCLPSANHPTIEDFFKILAFAQHGNRHGSPSRLKKNAAKNSIVMLDDIKAVAYDHLYEIDGSNISPEFNNILFKAPQFDNFLYNLLYYFDCFFKREELEQKGLISTSIEPGQMERKLFADACARVEITRKKLGRAYCHLLLGIELDEAHHMLCGRVSKTYKDRSLYETMYSFCCFVVWITFRRKNFEAIKKEMGSTLRSDTFNLAIRVKNAPDREEDEKTDVKNPKPKTTAAEYRKIHPKRPAIKSIINQRSPAVISILPSSKEEARHLFKHQRPHSPTSILSSSSATIQDDSKFNVLIQEVDGVDLEIEARSIRIGILHDSMENYNPISLQGGGQDAEQNADEEEAGAAHNEPNNPVNLNQQEHSGKLADVGASRAETALSQATTEAPSEF